MINNDINKNGNLNIYNTAARELKEELGISVNDATIIKDIKGTYLVTEDKTKSVGIVYKINKKEINNMLNSIDSSNKTKDE